MINKPKWLIVHHSAVSYNKNPDQLEAINNYHRKKWNFKSSLGYYVGYHYLISKAGRLTQTRADTDVGAHCKEKMMNWRSLGICIEGNFDEELPTKEQTDALADLLRKLKKEYNIPESRIVPHRHFAVNRWTGKPYKTCYGSRLRDNWARELLENMKINREQLEKIWLLTFKRKLDYQAHGYVGRDLDFVLDELLKSKENIYYTRLFKAAKAIEKELP